MPKLNSFFLGAVAGLLLLAGVSSAQTISIVSGNGQVVCPLCFANAQQFSPLVVVVKDANGNPMSGQTITWTLYAPNGGGLNQTTTVTSSSTSGTLADGVTPAGVGLASNTVVLAVPLISTLVSYAQGTITASVGGTAVTFTETVALAQSGTKLVSVTLESPAQGATFSGPAGSAVGTPVTVLVSGQFGDRVPGAELKIVPNTNLPGRVSCQSQANLPPNTALTDTTGTATCNLIFTGQPGPGSFTIVVGGGYFDPVTPFNFTVTAGAPGTIKIISGNNQSANPGSALTQALIAEVDDQAGTPLSNQPVTWAVTQGTATLSQQTTTSDSSGRVQTNATLGSGGTPVQIKVSLTSNPAVAATFTVTPNVVVTGISKSSGDAQTATVGTAFAQPLVVQVNNQMQGVPGIGVTFTVTSGVATLAHASVTTDSSGKASTTITAGTTPGPVVVTAATGSASTAFNLTVAPIGPGITSTSFYNAAGFQNNYFSSTGTQQLAISPCSLATIIAPGLAPGIQGAVVPSLVGPLPYKLANVQVQFGNSFAPIFSVVNNYSPGNDAVTVQVPCEVAPGSVQVTVTVGGGSANVTIPVSTISPGLFETVMSDNSKRAVLTRPDGSFVELENPARRGEIIRAYVTGLGPVTPAIGTNQFGIPDTDMNVNSTVVVGVNNGGVRVVDAKYAPDLVGVYVVDFEVPGDTATGNDIPFVVAVQQGNDLLFGNGSKIPIQ